MATPSRLGEQVADSVKQRATAPLSIKIVCLILGLQSWRLLVEAVVGMSGETGEVVFISLLALAITVGHLVVLFSLWTFEPRTRPWALIPITFSAFGSIAIMSGAEVAFLELLVIAITTIHMVVLIGLWMLKPWAWPWALIFLATGVLGTALQGAIFATTINFLTLGLLYRERSYYR